MNLDLLYLATELTGNENYSRIANLQAEKSMKTHIRPDDTTFHVVNVDQKTGEVIERMTHQGKLDTRCLVCGADVMVGYSDNSVWARGQAWGIYGFAQCGEFDEITSLLDESEALRRVTGLRTGRKDFIDTSRKLADVFLSLLPEDGVPWWYVAQPFHDLTLLNQLLGTSKLQNHVPTMRQPQ
jgi:hypothetical protein